ncbi:hypothetical protein ADK64_30965 [Streptomyces sp. MMG1121]|nr:hypothetical protein ADK64_30965 [Streptomyces sp. MMG1121]
MIQLVLERLAVHALAQADIAERLHAAPERGRIQPGPLLADDSEAWSRRTQSATVSAESRT